MSRAFFEGSNEHLSNCIVCDRHTQSWDCLGHRGVIMHKTVVSLAERKKECFTRNMFECQMQDANFLSFVSLIRFNFELKQNLTECFL